MDWKEFEKKEIILIDYFDTIVHRNVHPENVKMIWAKRLFESLLENEKNLLDDAYSIFKYRKKAEAIVEDYGTKKYENDYEEVCNQVYEMFKSNLNISKNNFFVKCFDTEIKVECEVQYVDQETLELLKNAKRDNKKVIIVSDFYLPSEAFERFLGFHKLSDLVDEIYISYDYDLRKDRGDLYKKVFENIDKEKAVMYGDNKRSDYEIPKSLGLKSILKDVEDYKKEYKDEKYVKELIKSLIKRSEEEGPYVGYFLQLYLFSEKLSLECIKNKYDKLFFVSREGQRLKEIFDLYNKKIETHYLMTSRYAMLETKEKETNAKAFLEYFNTFGLKEDEKIVMVDIGWKGTMQSLMSDIIPNESIGYYLGLNNQATTTEKCDKKGILFSAYPSKTNYYGTYTFNSLLEEQLMVADHGSVKEYKNRQAICFEDDNNKRIYNHLVEMRKVQNRLIQTLFDELKKTCFYLENFERLVANNYLDMSTNFSKEYREERELLLNNNKESNKHNDVFDLVKTSDTKKGKINFLRRRMKKVRKDGGEPIEYLTVISQYLDKKGTRKIYRILAKWYVFREKVWLKRREKKN